MSPCTLYPTPVNAFPIMITSFSVSNDESSLFPEPPLFSRFVFLVTATDHFPTWRIHPPMCSPSHARKEWGTGRRARPARLRKTSEPWPWIPRGACFTAGDKIRVVKIPKQKKVYLLEKPLRNLNLSEGCDEQRNVKQALR